MSVGERSERAVALIITVHLIRQQASGLAESTHTQYPLYFVRHRSASRNTLPNSIWRKTSWRTSFTAQVHLHLWHQFRFSLQLTSSDAIRGLREGKKCSRMTMWQNKPLQLASGRFMAYMIYGSVFLLLDTFTVKLILDRTTPPLNLYFYDPTSQVPKSVRSIPFRTPQGWEYDTDC